MPEIVLPTKAKQDDTNTKVTDIQTKTNNINTNVSTLLNGRVVKSVQRGVSNLTLSGSGIFNQNLTISNVNMSKSTVSSDITADAGTSLFNSRATLISPTQLTLTVSPNNAGSKVTVSWQVVEFY